MSETQPGLMSTDHPTRIQRRRVKGWRMPLNTIYVGRPTEWANWLKVGYGVTPEDAVAYFRADIEGRIELGDTDVRALRGRNLACWCPLDQPCHADVLLEIANA